MSNLALLADNPLLFEEVKAVLREEFSLDSLSTGSTNAQLGEIVRAKLDGLVALDRAFAKIAAHKSIKEAGTQVNRAR